MKIRQKFLDNIKSFIPLGEGRCHKEQQKWSGFENYLDSLNEENNLEWPSKLDRKNLGTLGGGNHFIELQKSSTSTDLSTNKIWLMIHSGLRNLGLKIAKYYNRLAVKFCMKMDIELSDEDLAVLPCKQNLLQRLFNIFQTIFYRNYALNKNSFWRGCFGIFC